MARPSIFPEWASNLITDGGTGLDNKIEPTAQWKTDGQLTEEATPRQYVNFNFDLIDLWIKEIATELDVLNTFRDNRGKQTVITSAAPTLTRDLGYTHIINTGNTVTLENVVSVGGGTDDVGTTIQMRTTNATTISLNAGATVVGFTGSIPANRVASFVIEDIPAGTGTQWACSISAGA